MKKKVRNIILTIIGTIVGVLTITVLVLFITGKISFIREDGRLWLYVDGTNGEDDTYDQLIKASKSTYPTDIFVYGEDCRFRDAVEYNQITALTDEQLKSDKDFRVIIINDLNGQISLSKSDLETIKRYTYEEKYIFIYLGMEQYSTLVDAEVFAQEVGLGSIDGIAVRHFGETVIQTSGIWDEQGNQYYQDSNDELLGEAIFLYLRTCYSEA